MGYRLHKEKRKIARGGRCTVNWSGRYRLPWMSKERSVSLKTSDKEVAEKRMREFIKREERTREGLPVPVGLWGESPRKTAEIIEDYLEYLNSKQAKPQYVRDTRTQLERLLCECSWETLDGITADSLDCWLRKSPCSLKTGRPLAAKTKNEYITSAKAMMHWLFKLGKVSANPLHTFDKLPTSGKEQKKRRAWTVEEIKKLYDSGVFYRFALVLGASTGLRRSEQQSLCWGDVFLDTENPFILPRKENTKNARSQPLPLTYELVEMLRSMKPENCKPDEPVLKFKIPKAEVLARDLAKVGIKYRDELGRDIDFHSLRYTLATRMTQSGANSRMIQSMSRHSTPNLTANVYTDASQLDTLGAVRKLAPILGVERAEESRIRSQKPDFGEEVSSQPLLNFANSQSAQLVLGQIIKLLQGMSCEGDQNGKMVVGTGFEPV